jgi:hypothetical protein
LSPFSFKVLVDFNLMLNLLATIELKFICSIVPSCCSLTCVRNVCVVRLQLSYSFWLYDVSFKFSLCYVRMFMLPSVFDLWSWSWSFLNCMFLKQRFPVRNPS